MRRQTLLFVGLATLLQPACGGGREAAPDRPQPVAAASPGGASVSGGESAGEEATPAPPADTGTGAVLTRPKATDQDFMGAITALESANPTADAEAAIGAGSPRLFGILGGGRVVELPGVTAARDRLPEGLRIAGIEGTSDEAGSRYQQRFQMLATRYARDYNAHLLAKLPRSASR